MPAALSSVARLILVQVHVFPHDRCAGLSPQGGRARAEVGDDRPAARVAARSPRRPRSSAACRRRRTRPDRDERLRPGHRHPADRPRRRSSPPFVDGLDVGEDQQHVGLELPGEHRRRPGPCPPPRPRPRGRGCGSSYTGGPPPPAAITMTPSSSRRRITGNSTTPSGRRAGRHPAPCARRRPDRPLAPPRGAAPPRRRSAPGRSAWSGALSAGSNRSTSVCVITVDHLRGSTRAPASAFCSDCWSM